MRLFLLKRKMFTAAACLLAACAMFYIVNHPAVVGAAAMAEGLVARMKRELGREDATVIATGGLASIVADSTDAFDVVDGQLTIKGICEIYRRMQELG